MDVTSSLLPSNSNRPPDGLLRPMQTSDLPWQPVLHTASELFYTTPNPSPNPNLNHHSSILMRYARPLEQLLTLKPLHMAEKTICCVVHVRRQKLLLWLQDSCHMSRSAGAAVAGILTEPPLWLSKPTAECSRPHSRAYSLEGFTESPSTTAS